MAGRLRVAGPTDAAVRAAVPSDLQEVDDEGIGRGLADLDPDDGDFVAPGTQLTHGVTMGEALSPSRHGAVTGLAPSYGRRRSRIASDGSSPISSSSIAR